MDVALIVVVAVLFAVIAFTVLKGRGARRSAREQERGEARASAEAGKAQHAESQRRQADVRAAHAERASNAGPDGDD